MNRYLLSLKLQNSCNVHHFGIRFVDHDMFMRYLGGGVGHTTQNSSPIHWQHSKCVFDDEEGSDEEVGIFETKRDKNSASKSDKQLDKSADEESEDISDSEL